MRHPSWVDLSRALFPCPRRRRWYTVAERPQSDGTTAAGRIGDTGGSIRALIQRVAEARVDIAGETVGEVAGGMLILVCAMRGDGDDEARSLARKIANLRIFESEPGKMNLSILASGGSALVVSQFTLAADASRGNRPGFSYAAPPDEGERLYELFTASLAEHGVPVATGRFGQAMQVHLVNDGPVTIWIDTAA